MFWPIFKFVCLFLPHNSQRIKCLCTLKGSLLFISILCCLLNYLRVFSNKNKDWSQSGMEKNVQFPFFYKFNHIYTLVSQNLHTTVSPIYICMCVCLYTHLPMQFVAEFLWKEYWFLTALQDILRKLSQMLEFFCKSVNNVSSFYLRLLQKPC